MFQLFAPFHIHARFGGRGSARPDGVPVPWAIRVETVAAARAAVACLKGRDLSRVEIVTGPYALV
jgi:hypothetical protein